MKKVLLLFSIVTVLALGEALAQGSTTASMRGRITDDNGAGLPGATVRATHTPTGTEWGNVTDLNGYFRLPNMNVGGPYKISVSFIGFETIERENIYLTLGQTFNLNERLSEDVTELEAVIVSASQGEIIDGNRTGASTFISKETIESLPTVGRSIGDFVRLTPQAQVTEGNDGLSLSIGGQNNRYNAIYIDGAVSNDVFGLAGSGTNGGQTGVTPISLDAIEQFNVSIAPFDVRQSGFSGGSVSAVTRSGSNEIEGSIYFLTQNEKLAGVTPQEKDEDLEELRLPDFSSQTYGFRVGGPLIKNKLFFFLNAESQRDEIPQPFQFAEYTGDASQSDVDRLVTFLNGIGYDPGTYTDNTTFLDSDKFLIKLDWNASDNHKVSIRHSYTEARNLEARSSSASGLRFQNGSEFFNSTTNTTALELKSNLGSNMANHLSIGATIVRDDRDPYDTSNDGPAVPFPAVFIDDGRGGFQFGSETFSTANLLEQDVITITDNLEYYKGKHTFLAGFNAELYTITNLFIPFNYGDYGWERNTPIGASNLDDFINGEPADDYIRSFSLRDNVTGDGSIAGVKFKGALFGFYVQDEYQALDNLKLTFGLRGDIQSFDDTPENREFNSETIPLITEAGYDLKGARTGQFIKPQFYFSPRIGFNYDVFNDQKTQIRGGWGIFTSRIPLVWPGGSFNNNGVNRGTTLDFLLNDDALRLRDWDDQPVGVDGDGNVLTSIDPNNISPSGDIDLFAEDFKIPQVWKANIGFDQKLPVGGLIATVEGLFTKTINQVYYQNVNLKRTPVGFLQGTPDDRPLYNRRDPIDGGYGRIIYGTNNKRGYAYNVSATLTKPLQDGIAASLSYSYGDSYSLYDGTSSQNSSQWRGLFTVDGRNSFRDVYRSDFSQAHRVIASVTYKKEYAGFMGSQITLFYEGRSGNPYSYIYGGGQNIQNEDSRSRALVYIPANASEIVLVDGANGMTAAQQWTALNSFIEDDPYLSENRGSYAERNSNRLPFENVVDLKFLQSFFLETANGKRNTIQLSLDIFNFTNFLSSNWGKRYRSQFSGVELLEFEGFQDGTNIPTYSFQPFNDIEPNDANYGNFDDAGLFSARWRMQFGIRYIFN